METKGMSKIYVSNASAVKKLTTMALMIALSVTLQLYLRVPGFSPMQHFFNVVCAILMGPWYSFVCALCTAIIRMSLFGVTILAVTGSVFGALLSGILYRATEKLPETARFFFAGIGEVIGTGVIGAIASYPFMALMYGDNRVTWFYYVPSWLVSTSLGAVIAIALLFALKSRKLIGKLSFRKLDKKDL